MKVPFYGLKSCNKNQIILSDIESRHCIKVLRYKVGDRVQVIDGKGSMYECVILDDNLQNCTLDIINKDNPAGIVLIPGDNPTGQQISQHMINKIANICVEKDIWLISDEAYRNIYFTNEGVTSIWAITNEMVWNFR